MKQILRIFAVVGVILLTALISAGSCDKKGDDGGGNKLDANIEVGKVDGVSTVDATKGMIKLLASKFPKAAAGVATDHADKAIVNTTAANYLKAFDVKFKAATAGMILAVNGDKTDVKTLTTPAPGNIKTDAAVNKGVHVTVITGTATGTLKPGANIYGVFADKTKPTAATVGADKAPFAFTPGAATQPVLWCVATLAATVLTPDGSGKLTGGQTATCYIASLGSKSLQDDATAWLATAAPFKKKIKVSFAGINTGDLDLKSLGLGDAAASLKAFNDGLTAANMAKIVTKVTAAKTALSQYDIEIVSAL